MKELLKAVLIAAVTTLLGRAIDRMDPLAPLVVPTRKKGKR